MLILTVLAFSVLTITSQAQGTCNDDLARLCLIEAIQATGYDLQHPTGSTNISETTRTLLNSGLERDVMCDSILPALDEDEYFSCLHTTLIPCEENDAYNLYFEHYLGFTSYCSQECAEYDARTQEIGRCLADINVPYSQIVNADAEHNVHHQACLDFEYHWTCLQEAVGQCQFLYNRFQRIIHDIDTRELLEAVNSNCSMQLSIPKEDCGKEDIEFHRCFDDNNFVVDTDSFETDIGEKISSYAGSVFENQTLHCSSNARQTATKEVGKCVDTFKQRCPYSPVVSFLENNGIIYTGDLLFWACKPECEDIERRLNDTFLCTEGAEDDFLTIWNDIAEDNEAPNPSCLKVRNWAQCLNNVCPIVTDYLVNYSDYYLRSQGMPDNYLSDILQECAPGVITIDSSNRDSDNNPATKSKGRSIRPSVVLTTLIALLLFTTVW